MTSRNIGGLDIPYRKRQYLTVEKRHDPMYGAGKLDIAVAPSHRLWEWEAKNYFRKYIGQKIGCFLSSLRNLDIDIFPFARLLYLDGGNIHAFPGGKPYGRFGRSAIRCERRFFRRPVLFGDFCGTSIR